MDLIGALLALLLLSPLFLLIALAIWVSSGKPLIFRQLRTGRDGHQFQLLKFRTMTVRSVEGPQLTRSGDPRVTSIGKWLRKRKLDELPQLVNVLRGDMSLVGPRPDLEEFWKQTPLETRRALTLSAGLTGAASLLLRDEEGLLAQLAPEHVSVFYMQKLLPMKAKLDLDYAARATFLSDCLMVLRSIAVAARFRPTCNPTPFLHEQLSGQ
jgi:lipopolysaccharide/colanic/teichoic acid biosynthesis glycosyltransferase